MQDKSEREEKILEAFSHIEQETKFEGSRAGPAKVILPIVNVYEVRSYQLYVHVLLYSRLLSSEQFCFGLVYMKQS